MKRYFVTNIEYDTTDAMGCYDIELPTQMVVEVEDEEEIADYISNMTGWLVNSYINNGLI